MSQRTRRKEATRAAIAEAARRLFAEKGYAGTRTRDIAEAAGIATGTLFNYAPTKEDIVLLLWKSSVESLVESGLEAGRQCEDPVDALVAVFEPIYGFYAEDLELGRVFLQQAVYASPEDPEMVRLNEGFIAALHELLAPHLGGRAFFAAPNAFAAYYLTLSGMLGGRSDVAGALVLFRSLLVAQRAGWEA